MALTTPEEVRDHIRAIAARLKPPPSRVEVQVQERIHSWPPDALLVTVVLGLPLPDPPPDLRCRIALPACLREDPENLGKFVTSSVAAEMKRQVVGGAPPWVTPRPEDFARAAADMTCDPKRPCRHGGGYRGPLKIRPVEVVRR